ncbi:amino acid transporter AVT1B [Hyalella azteca]|uniref:Amino acid transporter AVT1B n=1 Tax=Hyalella azteca TaxID=294128 RepID=A0A8B7N5B6_HYAAZ|nr:amino acid transporter AVT1B [Hyalella azteca]
MENIIDKSSGVVKPGVGDRINGLGYLMVAYFLVTTVVGAGFLSLPKAVANTGWIGIPLILLFGGSVGFAVTRLGRTWLILEERWPKYREPARQPYMDMAEKAFGTIGRRICFGCVMFTLVGDGIAFLVLMAGMVNSIIPAVSVCGWILIFAVLLWPTSFFGTPKDFWLVSIFAVVATGVTIVAILIQLFLDIPLHPDPQYPNPTIKSFFLGFSAIVFAFGGVSVFPTLQNDMANRREWWKSVIIGFAVIFALYLPVTIAGYVIIGVDVSSNILLDASSGVNITIAITLNVVNLLMTYIICFNPVAQALEDICNVPNSFNWKRVLLRTAVVVFEVFFALAVPDFGAILNLIGGSTISILSFIFPPLMYMRLTDMTRDETWHEDAKDRTIPLWERIYLWMIVVVAAIGSVMSTVFALMVILDPETLGASCFADFSLSV